MLLKFWWIHVRSRVDYLLYQYQCVLVFLVVREFFRYLTIMRVDYAVKQNVFHRIELDTA